MILQGLWPHQSEWLVGALSALAPWVWNRGLRLPVGFQDTWHMQYCCLRNLPPNPPSSQPWLLQSISGSHGASSWCRHGRQSRMTRAGAELQRFEWHSLTSCRGDFCPCTWSRPPPLHGKGKKFREPIKLWGGRKGSRAWLLTIALTFPRILPQFPSASENQEHGEREKSRSGCKHQVLGGQGSWEDSQLSRLTFTNPPRSSHQRQCNTAHLLSLRLHLSPCNMMDLPWTLLSSSCFLLLIQFSPPLCTLLSYSLLPSSFPFFPSPAVAPS